MIIEQHSEARQTHTAAAAAAATPLLRRRQISEAQTKNIRFCSNKFFSELCYSRTVFVYLERVTIDYDIFNNVH